MTPGEGCERTAGKFCLYIPEFAVTAFSSLRASYRNIFLPYAPEQKIIPSVFSPESLCDGFREAPAAANLSLSVQGFAEGLGKAEREASGRTIPRPVAADYFDTQLTDVSKHSFY